MRKYQNLRIYLNGEDFVFDVYQSTDYFPKFESYGITSQIRRAAVSITNNIAEGSSRASDRDFIRFLEYSIGSSFEVESMLRISLRRQYLSQNDFDELSKKNQSIQRQIHALIKTLKE